MKTKYRLLITLSLLINVIYPFHIWYRQYQYRVEISNWTAYAADLQALSDHKQKKIRLLQLYRAKQSDSVHERQVGTVGSFEIWTWYYYPELGYYDEFAAREFVNNYNRISHELYGSDEKRSLKKPHS